MTSQVKVDSIRHTGASADAITLASDGSCTAELTNRQGTNLLINGDCRVAQRGDSSTSTGIKTMDRWNSYNTSHGVTVTTSQQSLSSSDTGPWAKGFRKYSRIALSGAGTAAAGTQIWTMQPLEAQDIANSGWDYTSSSSYLTLSFWVRSSTAQAFPINLYTKDGTEKSYTTTYTVSSANTWEKKSIKIPGAAGLQFDDNNGEGLRVYLANPYHGTDFTSAATDATWVTYANNKKYVAVPSTWLTAGASTFDFTGAQLEVGEFASEFQHKSYAEELRRCQRYFHRTGKNSNAWLIEGYTDNTGTGGHATYNHPVAMREKPSVSKNGTWGTNNFSSLSFNWRDENATSVRLIMSSAGNGYAHCSETGSPAVYGSLEFDAEF